MRLLIFALAVFSAHLAHAAASDVPGSRDPELLGQRFEDAVIFHYEQLPFDKYEVPTAGAKGAKLASSRIVEGKITDVRYTIPANHSILEVYRNYENALKAQGFELLFVCEDKSCGGREFNHIAGLRSRGFQETPRGQRFVSARLPSTQGDAYVTVFVVKNYGIGGPDKDKVNVRVVTAEAKPMDSELVTDNGGASPGFACSKAVTRVEKMICANSELSTLDEHLGRYYEGINHELPEAKSCIKSDQLQWLKSVRNICKDNTCLKRAYLNRLSELDGWQLGMIAIQNIDLPPVPNLAWIIPALKQDTVSRKSGTALELIGRLGWAEDGSDIYSIKTTSGVSYLISLPGLSGVGIDRFPDLANEQNSTFMIRGYAAKVGQRNIDFDASHCVFFYRMPSR